MECISECYPQLEGAVRFLFAALFFLVAGCCIGSISGREAHDEELRKVREQREKDLRDYERMIKQRSRW